MRAANGRTCVPAKRWVAAAGVALLSVAGFAVGTPASSEAFPGTNGKIAYVKSNDDDTSDIWSMDPDGSNQLQLTDPDGYDSEPAWSPDGTKIAFQREGGNGNIWVMGADGSNETQLTFTDDGAGAPSWSPDGTKIVFNGWPDPSTGSGPALFVMNADGSGQTQLTVDNDWDRWPSWSPDGTKIALTRDDPQTGATEVWVVDADGSNAVQLTDSGDSTIQSMQPSWSPDGGRLTYVLRTSPTNYLSYVMNADGTDQHMVAGSGSSQGQFSPDGTRIALGFAPGTDDGIWTMAPDGSNAAPLLVGNVYEPTWQRLGSPIEPTTTTTSPVTSTTAQSAAAVTPAFTG